MENITRAFQKLQPKHSAGPDGLSAFFIKNIEFGICFPLMLIFNLSFQRGKLPDIWKSAVVMPVHKKRSPSDVANYRPISLTCICCKIMEHVIKSQLLCYLMQNNLITEHQHGFLAKHSTCMQLSVLMIGHWL